MRWMTPALSPVAVTLGLLGCSGQGSLEINPNPATWEQIDFHDADPVECDFGDGGCAPQLVTLTNTGTADLEVELPSGHDGETVCIMGWEPGEAIVLDALTPGAAFQFELAVCGYPPGAIDSEVTGSYTFRTNGGKGAVTLDYSYFPIRNIPGDDTGF